MRLLARFVELEERWLRRGFALCVVELEERLSSIWAQLGYILKFRLKTFSIILFLSDVL